MINQQGRLLPFRSYSEHEVVNFFAMNVTGENGMFVALETGQQDPANGEGYTTTSVSAAIQGTYTPRFENKRKVRATAVGDTKFNTVGVTLHTTAENDENGQKLILLGQDRLFELGFVLSGQSVPILTRGIVTLRAGAYDGTPIPGYVGLITGLGKISVANPATLNTGHYNLVAGKFLSTSGDAFGGYAQFKLEL